MKKETISAGQVYVDLLNRIKKINGDVGPEIEDIERTLSLILTCIPSGASSDNKLVTEEELPAAQVNSDWNATSGVAEILNKPTIPAAQVNADWNATSGVAQILNKPTIPSAVHNLIQEELQVTTGNWNYTSIGNEYTKSFTLPTPINADYVPFITINRYTLNSPQVAWFRTIQFISVNSGTSITIHCKSEPPENLYIFIQGYE